jgi:hypothetical protein
MVASERDGEIVGLTSNTNGRLCKACECCGAALIVGDLVRFHLVMLEAEGCEATEAMKVIKSIDGTEGCHVGLIPRYTIKRVKKK